MAKIHHSDLFGLRKDKYAWLLENDLTTTKWKTLNPQKPFYLFIPQNTELLSEYEQGWKINEILPLNTVGIVTGQDEKTIAFTKEEGARLAKSHELSTSKIQHILYRPFDQRFVVYDHKIVTRGREEVMRHMMAGQNLGLISARSNKSGEMNHFFATQFISEYKCGESTTNSCLLPLYLYPDPEKLLGEKRAWPSGKAGRHPNLSRDFIKEFSARLGLEFFSEGAGDLKKSYDPEDVFNYIYAVFHSPEYRRRYAQFLKIDFPRVPLISSKRLFAEMCKLGGELVSMHLLENPALENVKTIFPVPGRSLVEKGFPKFVDEGEPDPATQRKLKSSRVYINKLQYFDGVPKEAWEFFIGGYQVAEKWLKDRRGRELSHDDLTHYQKVIQALSATILLMSEIDKVIDSYGGWPIK